MGGFSSFSPLYTGTDPYKLVSNQRSRVWNYGDYLDQLEQQRAAQSGAQGDYYEQNLQNFTGDMAAGAGGYNPIEAGQIMGLYGANGIPGLADNFTSQQDLQGNYLTPEEQAGWAGNTGSYGDYFDPWGMAQAQDESAGFQRDAYGGLQKNLNAAVDPNALTQSQDYLNAAGKTLANNRNTVTGALYGEAGNVRGAISPTDLKQSSDAAQQIQMTPQQQQDIVTAAGISAGQRNAAAVGDLQRQTLAAGGSPEAVAAYRARMARESASDAADAMTKARVEASNAGASRALQGEQQRLGAEQYLTNTKTGTEMALGQQAVGAEQALGQQELGQENLQEQQRLGGQQYLTGAKMNAATVGGEAALGAEQNINAQQRQSQQFNTQAGTGIRMAQDQAATQRAAQMAQNRQGVNQYNQQTQYNQGLTANQLGSQRAAQVAGTRLGQQQFGIGVYGGLQGQKNANQQGAFGRQQQTFGTTAGAGNTATNYGLQANQYPSTQQKGISAGIGAIGALPFLDEGDIVTQPSLHILGEHGPELVKSLGAIGGAFGANPNNPYGQMGAGAGSIIGDYLNRRRQRNYGNKAESADGQIVDKPTVALLGENGPEQVTPLTYRAQAKSRPSVVMGKERIRRPMYRMYGEAA